MRGVVVNGDLVDQPTFRQRFHRPGEMWQVNTVHRAAVADGLVQERDPLVGVLGGQPLNEVQFGADRPGATWFGGGERLDDALS